MNRIMRRLPALVIAGICCVASAESVAAQTASHRSIERGIDAIVQRDEFANATWGIEISDPATGEILYAHNATKSMIPASTTKLATTAAALEHLGPQFRLQTRLYAQGVVDDGILEGNLLIRGGGDPTIAEDLDDYGYSGLLDEWVDSVRAAGIFRIEGDVVGDDDFFDDVYYGPGWQWDDLPFYYAPEISGLSYNENVVNFSITGSDAGRPGEVSWMPQTDYVHVRNSSITTPRNSNVVEEYLRSPGGNSFVLASKVPEGRVEREALAVRNPTLYFAHVFRETLQRSGIPVSGRASDVDAASIKPDYSAADVQRIAVHYAPPVASIAALVNKPSHNLAAESLLKTLGRTPQKAHGAPIAGTWDRGSEVVAQTLARAGIDTSRVRLRDGSGLSRLNVISPHALGQLLAYMWGHPDKDVREAFLQSLAIGGEDGTLSGRFNAGPSAGHVRARTGTMTSVSALAGYLSESPREILTFVIICNNYTVPTRRIRRAQDEIINLVARLTL